MSDSAKAVCEACRSRPAHMLLTTFQPSGKRTQVWLAEPDRILAPDLVHEMTVVDVAPERQDLEADAAHSFGDPGTRMGAAPGARGSRRSRKPCSTGVRRTV